MKKPVEIVHAHGTRIVQIQIDGRGPDQYDQVLAEAERLILKEEPSSVRALTLVGDTTFDLEAVEELTRFAMSVMTHVRGTAVVGLSPMKKVIFEGIRPHFRAPVGVFEDAESAKEWLAFS